MLVFAAGLLALASAAPHGCDTSGTKVECTDVSLSAMPTTFNRKTTHLHLGSNAIYDIIPISHSLTRTRRDVSFTCPGESSPKTIETAVDTDNEYFTEDKALVVQGDEDQSSTSDVTTFPDAIACLSELYDLNLYGNNLASIPALGSAGLGLVKLGIIDLSNNQIATLAADTFLGLTELKQLVMGNNRIPLLPPGLFAEEFKSFLHAGFENNYIASVPYKLLSSLADVNQFTLNVDENVLVCNDFVAAGAQSCKCNGAHAQYEQTASVFDDTDTSSGNAQVRVCRIGATTISHLEAISQVMTDMKASIDSIKAFGTQIDAMEADTATIKAEVANVHTKMDAAGCPKTGRRFL